MAQRSFFPPNSRVRCKMRISVVGMALVLALGLDAVAQAAPLDLKQVPADAKWLVSVDVDAMRASTVVQNAWKKCLEMHPQAKHMGMVKSFIGMDPCTDLHGITMYGKELGKHTGVMILSAKMDRKPLTKLAERAPDHKMVKHGDYEIHSWTAKHHGQSKPGAGAFYKDGIVFASSVEELKAALDLLGGKGSSVSADSPLGGRVLPGTTVLMRVTGVAKAASPGKCPVLKQMESARFAMGEYNGQSFFRAKAVMTNTEVVGLVKAVLDGGRALAVLHTRDDAQGKKMVDALKVTTEEKTLRISWSAPAADVWDMIQKHAKKWAEKRAKMGQKGSWPHKGDMKGPGAEKQACKCGKCPACQKAAAEKQACKCGKCPGCQKRAAEKKAPPAKSHHHEEEF